MTASLLLMACGHNSTSAQGGEGTDATEQLDSCWKQSATTLDGLKVEVTDKGGVKLVWTDWDKFMTCLTDAIGGEYPYDAPMTEQEIHGLNGKVKGLAVMGNPMNPYVYMLLEDNSVQLYSLGKMCYSWNFYAGMVIAKDIVKIDEELKDYSITVLTDKNGKQYRDDEFVVEEADLWGYTSNSNGTLIEHLEMGIDGSFTVTYLTGMNDAPYQIQHGTVTKFARNEETFGADVEYAINTKEVPEGPAGGEKVDIKGNFSMTPSQELDGHTTIVPTQGLNLAGFDEIKLGASRDMLIRAKIEEYLGE